MAGSMSRRPAWERRAALLLSLAVVALAVVFFPTPAAAAPAAVRADLCSVEEWQSDPVGCVDRLADVAAQRAQCLKAPTPETPDAGLAGWFASRPDSSRESGVAGVYSDYGYAGYAYTTYDIGCAPTLMHPDYKFENTVANGEFMLATAVIGASNALRERAWDPGVMWGWADPLVEKATRSIYTRVFTVFGTITLAVVGLYLLWRSRQAQMSAAMTTAGWAILVMVVVTALAAWPVFSARLADKTLISSLDVVHDAVGPPAEDIPPEQCRLPDKDACRDQRPPAIRASDTAVETMLYRNWLRGLVGSADSVTAQKYGEALYTARAFSWDETEDLRAHPELREQKIQQKNQQWMKVAEQIRTEDPEAYEYLTGTKGMERIGAGFIALMAAVLFALFDIAASLLVLLGFLLFRWAVIAAPVLGTVAILRPASAGFRRLLNSVVAALFNIVVFGTGAAVYLFAVDLIMSTPTLPGWLQVVLVWLCGIVGWLLLRPYRRITQLGGRDPAAAVASAGSWHRRFARDIRETAPMAVARPGGGSEPVVTDRPPQRVEVRTESLSGEPRLASGSRGPYGEPGVGDTGSPPPEHSGPRPRTTPPSGGGWTEPEMEPATPGYTLYRPRRGSTATVERERPTEPARRIEARPDGP
jgi:hypothetical protein